VLHFAGTGASSCTQNHAVKQKAGVSTILEKERKANHRATRLSGEQKSHDAKKIIQKHTGGAEIRDANQHGAKSDMMHTFYTANPI
jgi:hypothetical protein